MARRWDIRLIAVVGAAVALLLSAGCQGGGGRDGDARGDADASSVDQDGAEPGEEPEEPGEQGEDPASPAAIRPVDPEVAAAVATYARYLRAQAAALPGQARVLTDAVRRGDLAGARRNFARSRAGWQRIQSVGMLLPDLDRSIDGQSGEFASPTDPGWTGWHRLELILWTSHSTAAAKPYADRLDRDLGRLNRAVAGLTVTAPVLSASVERLVEDAISQKLPGTEDRYARTDLTDLAGNVDGARIGYSYTRAVLTIRSPGLVHALDGQFGTVGRTLARYRGKPYPALTAADRAALQAQLTTLAENLAELPSVFR